MIDNLSIGNLALTVRCVRSERNVLVNEIVAETNGDDGLHIKVYLCRGRQASSIRVFAGKWQSVRLESKHDLNLLDIPINLLLSS